MIKKIITAPLLVPRLEKELDLSEIGLLATMVNEVDADYKDINGLSDFLGERATRVKDTAESLTSKGYLIKNNGIYSVNKLRIKDMVLVAPNMWKEDYLCLK